MGGQHNGVKVGERKTGQIRMAREMKRDSGGYERDTQGETKVNDN